MELWFQWQIMRFIWEMIDVIWITCVPTFPFIIKIRHGHFNRGTYTNSGGIICVMCSPIFYQSTYRMICDTCSNSQLFYIWLYWIIYSSIYNFQIRKYTCFLFWILVLDIDLLQLNLREYVYICICIVPPAPKFSYIYLKIIICKWWIYKTHLIVK